MTLAGNQSSATRRSSPTAGRHAYKPKRPFHTVEGIGSEAWKRLDHGAISLLTAFYAKFDGYNRGNLSVPYKEFNASSLVYTRWIWQLVGCGFLNIIRRGRLQRNASIYALSDRWRGLSDLPARLDTIMAKLAEIEALKRQPKSPDKRMVMERLRKEILAM